MAASAPTTRRPMSPRTAPAWRRRVGVRPEHLLTCLSDPFARRGDRRASPGRRTRGRAPTRSSRACRALAIARQHRRLRAGAVRRRRGARHRRRACRLARRVHRRARSDLAAMERCGANRAHIVAAARPDDPAAELRGRAGIRRAFHAADAANARFFKPAPQARPRAVRSAGLHRRAAWPRRHQAQSKTSAAAPMPIPTTFFSYRRSVHRGEPDYGRHINAIALAD